jgi:hypothetical protein
MQLLQELGHVNCSLISRVAFVSYIRKAELDGECLHEFHFCYEASCTNVTNDDVYDAVIITSVDNIIRKRRALQTCRLN